MVSPLELHSLYKQAKPQKIKNKGYLSKHAIQLMKLGIRTAEQASQEFNSTRLGFLPLLPLIQQQPHTSKQTSMSQQSPPRKQQTMRNQQQYQTLVALVKTPTMKKSKFIEKDTLYNDDRRRQKQVQTMMFHNATKPGVIQIKSQQSSPINLQQTAQQTLNYLKIQDEQQQILLEKASQIYQKRQQQLQQQPEPNNSSTMTHHYLRDKDYATNSRTPMQPMTITSLTSAVSDDKQLDLNLLFQKKYCLEENPLQTESVEIKGQTYKPQLKLDSSTFSNTSTNFKKKQSSNNLRMKYSCYCKSYANNRRVRMATEKLYKYYTKRVLVAQETLTAERQRYPVLVIVLEGVLGYVTEQKSFMIRPGIIEGLIQLSQCFRIVLVSHLKQKRIKGLCQYLAASSRDSLVFDAVYKVQKTYTHTGYINYSQLLLDFGFRNSFTRIIDQVIILQPCTNEEDPESLIGSFECEEHFYLLNHAPVHVQVMHLALQPLNFTSIQEAIISLFGFTQDNITDPISKVLRALKGNDYSFKRNLKTFSLNNCTLVSMKSEPNALIIQKRLMELETKLRLLQCLNVNKLKVNQTLEVGKGESYKSAYIELFQQNMNIKEKIEDYQDEIKNKLGDDTIMTSRGWEWERERERLEHSRKFIKRKLIRILGGIECRPMELMVWAQETKRQKVLDLLSCRQKSVMFSTGMNPVSKDTSTVPDPNSFINDFFKQTHRTLKPS